MIRKKLKSNIDIKKFTDELTVIVPAYNEAESIGDTIKSLKNQTFKPKQIIVVDDCSNDGTGDIVRSLGVTVIRPPKNTGTKAGAQNFALKKVKTKFTMAIDADTTLAMDALEKLLVAFEDPNLAAVCGFVLPRYVKTIWERGRYIEYLFAFTFFKQVQDYFGKPLISSGCFSAYKTDILVKQGGWSTRTMAEDMDLTWSFYQNGYGVRFMPDAVCFPIEPHNFNFMSKQLKRWSHGFVQNLKLHWKNILHIPYLNFTVAVGFWDATVASLVYIFLLPILAIYFRNPLFLLGYFLDMPTILVPVFFQAKKRRELGKAIASIPSFFVLRFVNCIFMLGAIWSELIVGKSLTKYEKGH